MKKHYECPLKYPEDYPSGYSKKYIACKGWPKETPSDVDGNVYIPALKKLVAFSRKKVIRQCLYSTWDFISGHSVEDLVQRIQRGEDMARYALEKFADVREAHEGLDLWIEHSPHALTIRFRQTNDRIVFKYSLSNETLFVGDKKRAYSHIYLMDSVTKELIDRFTRDLDHNPVVHGRGLGFR